MFLLAGTANAFAGTNVKAKKAMNGKNEPINVYALKKASEDLLVVSSCKVSVSYGKTNITINYSCECSQKSACDIAYKIATILL